MVSRLGLCIRSGRTNQRVHEVEGPHHRVCVLVLQEPMSLLKGTLQQLAEHKTAPERYLIVLAMEDGEEGHAAKAGKLIAEFGSRCAWCLHLRARLWGRISLTMTGSANAGSRKHCLSSRRQFRTHARVC